MPTPKPSTEHLLTENFFTRHPEQAADQLEMATSSEGAEILAQLTPGIASAVFRRLAPAKALDILIEIDRNRARRLLRDLDPQQAGALLSGLGEEQRQELLAGLAPSEAGALRSLMQYPEDSAGRLMDPRIAVFRPGITAGEALERLRSIQPGRRFLDLLLVDEAGRLSGSVPLHQVVLAEPDTVLSELLAGPPLAVSAFATREEVVDTLELQRLANVPVIDYNDKPIGSIRLAELVSAVQTEITGNLVSVTGASKEERALSTVGFAVKKRLPWLQLNLLTAFLAASVVGLFEDTIARFTALAVLLPVVAGQSGNTGAQALAVVLRGLTLREITLRHWARVVFKEFSTGLLNGLGVALVTCAGVYVWSGSTGIVLVIGIAMILSMAIAGVAGALIPILLSMLGQDPAQSSSIVLTTVTDVFGFFSFLGLAVVFSSHL